MTSTVTDGVDTGTGLALCFVVVLSTMGVAVVAAPVKGGPWHKWTKELVPKGQRHGGPEVCTQVTKDDQD